MRLSAVAALVMLLAAASAGCVGEDDPAQKGALEAAVDRVAGPSEEELRRTPGSIEGLVLSPSIEPIAGARVTLLRENLSTISDAGGFFRFAGLANAAYLLSAEAEGYLTRTVQASATNGTVFVLNLTLTPAPSRTPYTEVRELQGLLSCAVTAAAGDERRDAACAAADPNHRDTFEIDLAPDGKSVVIELAWDTASNPGASRLSLHGETVGYGAMDEDLGTAVGEGYARLEIPTDIMEKYYPEGGRFRLKVALEPGADAPIGLALQTPFTLVVTAFHHEAAPAGYGVLSGGGEDGDRA